jgi:hypothetical protein
MISAKESVFSGNTVPIFLFLGFVGSGKSTIACQTSKYLNSIGCKAIPVDGDNVFGVSMTDAMRLGQERQPLTIWEVAQVIMKGAIPVVSAGGGVFVNYKTKTQILSDHLKKFFPEYDFVFYTFVPSNNGVLAIQPTDVSYIDELKTIYNEESDLRVSDIVNARIERGEWNPNTKIPMIIKISKGNIKFATEFIQNSLKIFTFPIVEPSMYDDGIFSEKIDTSVLDEFEGFTFVPPGIAHYHQFRILADFGQPKMGHITMEFVPYSKEPQSSRLPSWISPKEVNGRIVQTEMIMPEGVKTPKKSSSFILLTGGLSDLVCDEESGVAKTHVTLNPTNFHFPNQMGDIAIALNSGRTFIDLKTKNGDTIKHNLKSISDYPKATGRLIVPFFIP